MGRSTFNVPEGVIRDKVTWYAVIYRLAGEEVLVAKPAPAPGAQSASSVMVRRAATVDAPVSSNLEVNDSDEGVVALLSELLGIPANSTEVPIDSSRGSYEANIKHTLYYLFQKQGIVANKDQLLYRQRGFPASGDPGHASHPPGRCGSRKVCLGRAAKGGTA